MNSLKKMIFTTAFVASVGSLNLAQAALNNNPITFTETFSSAQEVGPIDPATPTNVTAVGNFSFDTQSHDLTFKIVYSNLSGAATMAHFHQGAIKTNGPVLQTICGQPAPALLGNCATTTSGVLQGTWHVPDNDIAILLNGDMFVNLHTTLNAKGEIRAQLQPNA
ncbi:MAG: CHRD domain-containing protein [Legionellales bacterium]|nr:CHRD domain-containing protein [Legionellales bacterium]